MMADLVQIVLKPLDLTYTQWKVLEKIVHKLFSWLNQMKMNPNGLFRHIGSPKKFKGQ